MTTLGSLTGLLTITIWRVVAAATIALAVLSAVPTTASASVAGALAQPSSPGILDQPPSRVVEGGLSFVPLAIPDGYQFEAMNVTGTVALLLDSARLLFLLDIASGVLTPMGVNTTGLHERFQLAEFSPDGSTVIFTTNRNRKLYRHDIATAATSLVAEEPVSGIGFTGNPSTNGRYVLHQSGQSVVRIDTLSGQRVSAVSDPVTGQPLTQQPSRPLIVSDGSLVVVELPDAPQLDPSDSDGQKDVYVFDLDAGTAARFVPGVPHVGRITLTSSATGNKPAADDVLLELTDPNSGEPARFILWNPLVGTQTEIDLNQTGRFRPTMYGDDVAVTANTALELTGQAALPSSSISNRGIRVWNLDRNLSEWHQLRSLSQTQVMTDGRIFGRVQDPALTNNGAVYGFLTGALDGVAAPDSGTLTITGVPERTPDTGLIYTAPITINWTTNDPLVAPPPSSVVDADGLGQAVISSEVCDASGQCSFGSTLMNVNIEPPDGVFPVESRVIYEQIRTTDNSNRYSVVGTDTSTSNTIGFSSSSASRPFFPLSLSPDHAWLGFYGSSTGSFISGNECQRALLFSPDSTRMACFRDASLPVTAIYDVTSSGVSPILQYAAGGFALPLSRHALAWLPGDVVVGFEQIVVARADCPAQSSVLYRAELEPFGERTTIVELCGLNVVRGAYDDMTGEIAYIARPTNGLTRELRVIGADGTNDRRVALVEDFGASDAGSVAWTEDGDILVRLARQQSGAAILAVDPDTGAHNDVINAFQTPNGFITTQPSRVVGGTVTEPVAVSIPTPTLNTIRTGIEFEQRIYAAGGAGPWTFAVTNGDLPAGLELDPETGIIFGFASEVTAGTVTVTAADTEGATGSREFVLDVTQVNSIPVVDLGGPYTVRAGQPFNLGGSATDADGDDITYEWDLDEDGETDFIGPLADIGTDGRSIGDEFAVAVIACDPFGACSQATTVISVVSPVTIITGAQLSEGVVGVVYDTVLEATGGVEPYTWAVASGSLPTGLTLDPATGVISGTPSTAGEFGFTVTVTDSDGATATKPFATGSTPPPASPGQGYQVPVSITPPVPSPDAPAPSCDSYALAGNSDPLPDGLTIDPITGVISGAPTTGGTFQIIVECAYTGPAGPSATTGEFTIVITDDDTPPAVTGTTDREPETSPWFTGPVTITWTATDDSGVASSPPQMTVDTQGADQVIESDESCDPTGNCATGELIISLDSVSPTVVLFGIADGASILLDDFQAPTCEASDEVSGLKEDCTVELSEAVNAELGLSYTATATATDNAGNQATATAAFVVEFDADTDAVSDHVDNCPFDANTGQADGDGDGIGDVCDDVLPPVVVGSVSANAAGWLNSLDAEITWTAVDPLPSLGITNGTATSSGLVEGVAVYTSPELCDDQGNCATGTFEVSVDVAAPTLILNAPGNGSSILVANYAPPSCSASDELSGLDGECSVNVSDPLELPGSLVYTATASTADLAGNSTSVSSTYTVVLDVDAPTITATPEVEPNDFGWWNGPVSFSFVCEDPQSGVASCPADVPFDEEGANQSATVTAIDNAGNEGTLLVSGINLDLTDPVVAISVPKTEWTYGEVIDITCEATDDLSGIASLDCPDTGLTGADLGDGTHVLSVMAIDVAGNETTATVTITVELKDDFILEVATGFVADEGNKANGLLNPLTNHLDDTPAPQWERACEDIDRSKLLTTSEKAILNGLVEEFAETRGITLDCANF